MDDNKKRIDFRALITELGIDKLPEDQQKQIFDQLFQALQKSVGLRVATILTAEQMKQVEEIGDKDGDDAALDEIERLVPNYWEIYQEEIDQLKQDMLPH